MTVDVCRELIQHPGAWSAEQVGGKEGLTHRLSEAELAAFDEVLAATRHKAPQQVLRSDVSNVMIVGLMTKVRDIILNGRGAIIISGITHERYSEEDFERIYWVMGLFLGNAVTQSVNGERLGHVRHETHHKIKRGYQATSELILHTDWNEIVGLMSVQKARSGGFSRIASALHVHNEVFRNHPEYLDALYRGVPFHRNGQQKAGEPDVTPFNVPIFCYVDGLVSCTYTSGLLRKAARETGKPFPPDFQEAIDYFDKIGIRDEIMFMLEPGEICLLNNYTMLHGRTDFEDFEEPARKRHLLRLWLDIPDGRKVLKEMDPFQQSESGGKGIAAQKEKATSV